MFSNHNLTSEDVKPVRWKITLLSGQKNIKNAKYGQFGKFFINCSLRSNSVTGQKLMEMPKLKNSNEIFLGDFQTICAPFRTEKCLIYAIILK